MGQRETNTTPEQLAGPSNATSDIKCKQEPDMDTSVNIKTEVIKQEENAARVFVKSESLSIAGESIQCKQESHNIKTEIIKQEENAARVFVKSEPLSIAVTDIQCKQESDNIKTEIIKQEDNAESLSVKSEPMSISEDNTQLGRGAYTKKTLRK